MQIEANLPGSGQVRVDIEGELIAAVAQRSAAYDLELPFISPGFLDLQLNGFGGVDFSNAYLTPEVAVSVAPMLWREGVTSFCPTLITNSRESLVRSFRVLEAARRENARFASCVPSYHLEGPYFPPGAARGVHDPAYMRPPSWDEFQELQDAAGGNIGLITLAPELPGAIEFIQRASRSGVVVGLGHTEATPEEIHAAASAGARLNTHLGNGCPQLLDRHHAPFWAQLADDRLSAGLICDRFHLTPDMVRIIASVKGSDKCVLVTDAIHAAGLPPGRYRLLNTEIELLPSGQAVRLDRGSLAGSALTMPRAIAVFRQFAGASLSGALRAATWNPAKTLNRPGVCSSISAGELANLVLFRNLGEELVVESTMLRGDMVYP